MAKHTITMDIKKNPKDGEDPITVKPYDLNAAINDEVEFDARGRPFGISFHKKGGPFEDAVTHDCPNGVCSKKGSFKYAVAVHDHDGTIHRVTDSPSISVGGTAAALPPGGGRTCPPIIVD